MNPECYATGLQNRQYNFKPHKNMAKYKDKLKLVSTRHVAGKLLQIDQSSRNEQNDGRIYLDKKITHMQRNIPNSHK